MRSPLWLGALTLACGVANPPPRPPEPPTVSVAPPEKAPEPEPPPPTGPVVLDNAGEPPRWLDPPTPIQGRKAHVYDSLLASGDHAAVTRTSVGEYFGFDEASGVVGPLELPGRAAKLLFGPGDSLLVLTEAGELFAAPSVSSAKSVRAFEPRTAPANVVSWDSAGGYLVATDGKQVHLSRDGGKSWSVTKSAAWGTLRTVVVRFDGVMAAQGGPAKTPLTFVSRDDGKSWQRSSFQPERISRSGAFIWSDVWRCTAVLSENGSSWSKGGEELARFRATRSWTSSFLTGTSPEGFRLGAHRALAEPSPPKVPGAKDRRTGRGCPPPPGLAKATRQAGILGLLGGTDATSVFGVMGAEGVSGLGSGLVGGIGSSRGIGGLGGIGYSGHGPTEPAWGACSGVSCLRPPVAEPTRTRTRFAFFRDARCSASSPGLSCTQASSFERAPHVAIHDESTGKRRVAELPNGCTPLGIASAAGLGFLSCKSPTGFTLHAADSSGAFKDEGPLSEPSMLSGSVAVGSDGTLLFHERCVEKKPCRAWVRRPVEPGVKGAWRELKVGDAVGYRVLSRGRAVAVARGADEKRLDFWLSEAGKPDAPLARGITFEGDVIAVHVDEKDRIVVRERREKGQSESFVVGVDGKRHPR